MPGSGKEVFVETAMKLDFSVIRMGDVVRQHAADSGLQMGDISVGSHANSEREKHGNDIWAIRTIEKMPHGDVIIDGSRSLHELEHFREHLDKMTIVGINAPKEIRFKRLQARGREDDPTAIEDFERREERESGWGIREALESSDILISNDSSLDAFRTECRRVLEDIR